MELTAEIAKADYKSFLIDYYFYQGTIKSWLKLIGGAAVMTFILLLYINRWSGWPAFLLLFAIVLLLLYGIFVVVPFSIKMLKFNFLVTHLLFLNQKVSITAYASGISIENESVNTFFSWEQIKRILASSNYISIVFKDKTILLIPRSDITNDNAAKLFLYKVNNGWQNTKEPSRSFQEPGSPSYLWGLIGFIPILGALNGIIMILMGVFQYKDYKYCFIGLMGVLFSFGFFEYVDIFPSVSTMNSPAMVDTLKNWTQDDLNQLVKNIEFYKYEHNSYPDSLQQLENDNKTVDIHDPIIGFRHLKADKVNTLFNYKKIGDKYTLFSSGPDQVPYTRDDIYPIISVTDMPKSGFIKP